MELLSISIFFFFLFVFDSMGIKMEKQIQIFVE